MVAMDEHPFLTALRGAGLLSPDQRERPPTATSEVNTAMSGDPDAARYALAALAAEADLVASTP